MTADPDSTESVTYAAITSVANPPSLPSIAFTVTHRYAELNRRTGSSCDNANAQTTPTAVGGTSPS